MQITDVRLRKVNSENRMKAVASVTFDNEFVIHDIKVIESQNGLFIAMPSRKTPNGEFKDIAHPINAETRERIQASILEAYEAPESETDFATTATTSTKEVATEKAAKDDTEETEESAE